MPQQGSNLSHLSDAQLDALIKQKEGGARGLSSMSDEELDNAIAAKSQEKNNSGFDPNALKVAVETGGTFGARPFIAGLAGAAGAGTQMLRDAKYSQILPSMGQAFSEARKGAQDEQADLSAKNPKTFLAGELAGSMLMPGGAIKTIAGTGNKLLQAGRIGAAFGGAQALGQADDAADAVKMVGTGALLGAGGEAAIQGTSAVGRMLKNKLNKSAAGNALRAAGAMLKDWRNIEGKGRAQEVGDFIIDNKLATAGDSVEAVAEKSKALKDDAGKALDSIYNFARNNSNAEVPGLNLKQQKMQILEAAKAKLGDSEGAGAALNRLATYLDERIAEYGDRALDPRKANDIKGALDAVVNYARDPLKKDPPVEKAFHAARDFVSKQIDSSIEAIGAQTNSPELLANLKQANKVYGNSTTVSNIASDRVRREEAKSALGLRQGILMSGGGITGAILSPDDRMAGALGGIAAGASLRTFEKYGPAVLAQAEKALANKIGQSAVLRKLIENNPATYQTLLQNAVDELGLGHTGNMSAPRPRQAPQMRLTQPDNI